MMRLPSRSGLTLVVLGVLFSACGDDDDPVAADSPCDDANTTCLSLQLKAADMTYLSFYDLVFTTHGLSWSAGPAVLSDYGPGQRVLVFVTFDPPIEVRYDHSGHAFQFVAGPDGSFDKFATPTTNGRGQSWTASSAAATCLGGTSTRIGVVVHFEPLTTGEKLSRVTFDVTIPETYDSGDPVLAGDLGPITIELNAIVIGSSEGNPPAWPEGHPLP